MTVSRRTVTKIDEFDYPQEYSTTPGHNGWTIKDTSPAGTPTYLNVTEDGGAAKLTLANTSEAEILTLYYKDVLPFDLAHLQHLWWIAKVEGLDSVTDLVLGLASAQNDTEDDVAVHAWFKIDGSVDTANVVVETDDGTNDNDDKATDDTLAGTFKKLERDFTFGIADVRFLMDGERVAADTKFDMSKITAGQNVQPFVQLHKASGSGVGSVSLAEFGVQYTTAYGA